jgi:hypothetical protein
MTFENEYYLSKKPTTFTMGEVAKYLMDNQLQYKVRTQISDIHLLHDTDGRYMEHIHAMIARQFAENMLETKKIDFTFINRPFDMSKIIESRTIVMTDKELLALLAHFGVNVHSKSPKDRPL